MFDSALKIFLLLTPIIVLPLNGLVGRFQWFQFGYFSASPSLLQLQFFQYGVIMLFLISLFEKQKRMFTDKWFGILFLVYILSIYFHPKTIQAFHNIFLGVILYRLVSIYTKDVKSVLRFVCILSSINTVFAVLQFFNIHPIYNPTHEIIGLMSYKSHLGIYQAVAIPLCHVINPCLTIIPLAGLLLSKSMTAIIPAIIGMCFLFREKIIRSMSMPMLGCGMSLIVLIAIKWFYKLSLRFDVWIYAVKESMETFLGGHGLGAFNFIENTSYNHSTVYPDPYSVYLEIFYSLGVFGIIAFLLFVKNHFFQPHDSVSTALMASCLILLIAGAGYSFMDYPRLAGTAIVLFALLRVKKMEVHFEN